MPTGQLHARICSAGVLEKCHCTIGEDHDENGWYEDDGDDGESSSVNDAADIWRSNGMDEDYMFG